MESIYKIPSAIIAMQHVAPAKIQIFASLALLGLI